MALKLADLKKATKTTTLAYAGETVTLTYRPAALTPQVQFVANALVELGGDGPDVSGLDPAAAHAVTRARSNAVAEAIGAYIDILAGIIVSWDVLGADGQPLPVTRAVLADFPYEFINALFGALRGGTDAPNATSVKS